MNQSTDSNVRRDAALVIAGVLAVVAVASLVVGNVALLSLPVLAIVAATFAWRAGLAHRAAIFLSVVVAGGYFGLLAHWALYDGESITTHWTTAWLTVRGVGTVAVVVALVSAANARRWTRAQHVPELPGH
ncbi:MAG: hypothetical protein ABIO67_12125 [Mycobacteriales bacterium]